MSTSTLNTTKKKLLEKMDLKNLGKLTNKYGHKPIQEQTDPTRNKL